MQVVSNCELVCIILLITISLDKRACLAYEVGETHQPVNRRKKAEGGGGRERDKNGNRMSRFWVESDTPSFVAQYGRSLLRSWRTLRVCGFGYDGS